jgi:hypothetical protein
MKVAAIRYSHSAIFDKFACVVAYTSAAFISYGFAFERCYLPMAA